MSQQHNILMLRMVDILIIIVQRFSVCWFGWEIIFSTFHLRQKMMWVACTIVRVCESLPYESSSDFLLKPEIT